MIPTVILMVSSTNSYSRKISDLIPHFNTNCESWKDQTSESGVKIPFLDSNPFEKKGKFK